MYSVVLMTALTAGGATPDFHWRSNGCHSCYSGSGYCHGSYSCYGCSGYHGCYSGYGCGGYRGCYSTYCYGGSYGHWGHGHACFSAYQCHGSYGCSGWNGCYGCSGCYGVVQPPAQQNPGPQPKKNDGGKGEGGKQESGKTNSVRSTVVIELPADAKLYVDGVLMNTQSAKRVFVTPELPKGKVFYYDLKAELERNGQPISITGRIVLTPGQEINATLTEATTNGTFVVRKN